MFKRGLRVRLLIMVCLGLLLVPLALAAPDIVFDKIISHGTTITLNGSSYEVRIGSANDSLVKVVSSFESVDLELGDCFTRRYDKFCYVRYADTQKIEATLTDYSPFIEVDRTIGSKTLNLGERTIITLSFENTGGTEVDDFYFREQVPSMLGVINASGCSISDDDQVIEWSDTLFPDEPVSCSYVVEAREVGVANYAGKISTNNIMSSSDVQAIPQVVITTKEIFHLDIVSSKYDLEAAQPFVLTFLVENLKTGSKGDNLSIKNISIDLGDDFEIKNIYSSPFYTFSNSDEFRFSGNVLPEETLEQQIELAATTIDPNISLNVIITYQLGSGPITSFTRVIPFHQSFEPLWCDYLVVDEAGNNLISLQKLNNTLPGFDRGEIFVYVYNENQYLNFEKLVYFDTGDIKFSPVGTINSLRKHDDAALTSALFSFDDLESKKITSQMKIKYNALGSNLESTCSGNILVLKPSFVHLEKELSFVNVTIDDTHVKLLPQVTVKVANNFFLPIKNILVSEVLPAAVFSNNNTQKTVSLSTLDEDYFKYNFIVPDDYVTLHGLNIPLETKVSYVVFGKSLSDSIKITVNANDVISAQKGVVLETLIDTKIEQLTEEINKSLVASQQSQEVNDSFEPEITYSPFLDYFSLSLIIFLFFLGILFLNFHYGLIPLFKKRRAARRMDRLAKKEADFAKQYGSFVKEEGSYEGQLRQGKQSLKQEKDSFLKQEREFRKMMKSLKSKELLANALLEKERKELQLLQNQQESIQKKMALVNRDITAQEAKKQSIDVQRKDERAALEKKKEAVLKAEEFVSSTQGKIHDLESSIGKMKSDFESSYEKNELVIHQKLDKVKGELSELDKEYDAKRKILKEEESHLEHRDS